MEKKIDLVVSKYYELSLQTNPENGNYMVKTAMPKIKTIEEFEVWFRYAMPSFFTLTNIGTDNVGDKHSHIKDEQIPMYRLTLVGMEPTDTFIWRASLLVHIGKKAVTIYGRNEDNYSYRTKYKIIATMYHLQETNSFNFFRDVFYTLAGNFFTEQKVKDKFTELTGETVNSIWERDNFRNPAFVVYINDGSFVVEALEDGNIKLNAQYHGDDDCGGYSATIKDKHEAIQKLQEEIAEMERIEALLEQKVNLDLE